MLYDLRFAIRSCLREPGFTLFAMLTLALGIGAMTMMYSVVYNVLLNPFPYTDPRGMVDVVIRNTADKSDRGGLSTTEFRAFVDESDVFEEAVGAHSQQVLYSSNNGPEPFMAVSLTPNTFRFLGVNALLGRTFAEEDARPGSPKVAVLSHQTWSASFGADPTILGRHITLDKTPVTIIGVMPPRFAWNDADVWLPDPADRADPSGMKKSFWLQARLKPGVTMQQAEAQLNPIAHRLAKIYPDRFPKHFNMTVFSVIDWVVGRFRGVLYTLFGAVGLLLLIACCNVANMLLARATIRARAYAIRTALGASRFRILQQNFFESLVLAIGAGILGVCFAFAGLAALKPFIPAYGIARETVIEINGSVLLFSLLVSTITALLFGVLPVIRNTRKDISADLVSSGKGSEITASQGSFRNFLVISEVALSLVLLCGAGVLMKSFLGLIHSELGFSSRNLSVTRIHLPDVTLEEKKNFFKSALERIGGLPGVSSVAITQGAPPYGGSRTGFNIPGKVHTEAWNGLFEACDEAHFVTLGVSLKAGVSFTATDIATARPVAVINETLRSRFFGTEDPLGKTIVLERFQRAPASEKVNSVFQVIGVVQDFKNRGPEAPVEPAAFIPYTSTNLLGPNLMIRTSSDPGGIVKSLRSTFTSIRSTIVQRDPLIVEEMLSRNTYARPRFTLILMTVFGTLGLVLVATGVYGVMSYVVSRQIREIGIRMALGAQRSQISRWVLSGMLRLLGIGILLGSAASLATNRIIALQLTNVESFDAAAFAIAIGMIVLVAAIACFQPAFRATRVDPASALRQE